MKPQGLPNTNLNCWFNALSQAIHSSRHVQASRVPVSTYFGACRRLDFKRYKCERPDSHAVQDPHEFLMLVNKSGLPSDMLFVRQRLYAACSKCGRTRQLRADTSNYLSADVSIADGVVRSRNECLEIRCTCGGTRMLTEFRLTHAPRVLLVFSNCNPPSLTAGDHTYKLRAQVLGAHGSHINGTLHASGHYYAIAQRGSEVYVLNDMHVSPGKWAPKSYIAVYDRD
jgi:hypothetical protein